MIKYIFIALMLFSIKTSTAQWQPEVRLTVDPALSATSATTQRSIASNGNFIHIIFYDERDGHREIYYKRSTDGGISWEADKGLTIDSFISANPSISVSGSYVHVAWIEFRDPSPEIYYKRSTDNGLTWGAEVRLTNELGYSYNPSIASSGSFVGVTWYDGRNNNEDIFYKSSSDGGTSWSTDIPVSIVTAPSLVPSIAMSGLNVHLAWIDFRDGNSEVYYRHSTDGGINWGMETRLTNDTSASDLASLSVSGSLVHILWYDNRNGNNEIYYLRSTDNGATWGAETRLTNNISDSQRPSVCLSGSDVHIVWSDSRDGNFEIYYKHSTDYGLSWGADQRLTSNSGTSFNSTITSSGSGLHLVWWDDRDGNREIYYRHNLQNVTVNIKMIEEGFYNNSIGHLNMRDTVKAFLRNSGFPYAVVDSAKSAIDSLTYFGNFSFKNSPAGSYYIVVTHRNSLETWSKSGGQFLTKDSVNTYNFVRSITQAFGSNMTLLNPGYGIYSGDVNQDGSIDLSDITLVFNDAISFLGGYIVSDVTGDRIVDLSDLTLVFNNSSSFVEKIVP